jgi:site-specific DNA-methyltransferase (adenine-specific)
LEANHLQSTLVSDLFSVLDRSADLIKNKRHSGYLEGLAAAGEDIGSDRVCESDLKDKLLPLYHSFFQRGMTAEDVRRAFQLAILKGLKANPLPGHEMTPDALVILIGHLVSVLMRDRPFSILDPAVGFANLLTGILNQSKSDEVTAYGAEVDDLTIRLAYANVNLQQHEVQLFHQDGLKPILSEAVDFAVCDVPVGIYPDRSEAKTYELGDIGGKAYTHFLFIEQGMRHLKEAGYLLYMIPNTLFLEDRDRLFHRYIRKHAVILSVLQLPLTLFKTNRAAKSILLLQKKGKGVTQPKQVLLAEMPDFMNEPAMRKFLAHLDHWFENRSF